MSRTGPLFCVLFQMGRLGSLSQDHECYSLQAAVSEGVGVVSTACVTEGAAEQT